MHIPLASRVFILIAWLALVATPSHAVDDNAAENPRPAIAIIIDDLGHQRGQGLRALALPGPITCAFLPRGAHTVSLARRAHTAGKEVMLHLPMQSMVASPAEPGMLTLDMSQRQFLEVLDASLDAVPHVRGLNNHQGSLMTRHPGNMAWLMQALRERGDLFFVDSRTTHFTVAHRLAGEYGIPVTSRNVFLDHDPNPAAIRAEFRRLLAIARRDGTAVGIGHPSSSTLQVLADELQQLPQHGVQLLPVSRLIEIQNQGRLAWQTSLSR